MPDLAQCPFCASDQIAVVRRRGSSVAAIVRSRYGLRHGTGRPTTRRRFSGTGAAARPISCVRGGQLETWGASIRGSGDPLKTKYSRPRPCLHLPPPARTSRGLQKICHNGAYASLTKHSPRARNTTYRKQGDAMKRTIAAAIFALLAVTAPARAMMVDPPPAIEAVNITFADGDTLTGQMGWSPPGTLTRIQLPLCRGFVFRWCAIPWCTGSAKRIDFERCIFQRRHS